MEKFCLKWNDFQTNVSRTFSSLRQEAHLFDVTLVSDDEQHIAAHKLVLSASSDFFKNIIKKAPHSSPMIFLSGFKSRDLLLIMDYIYQGEVQVLQSDLNGFLDVAQRLKIEGLMGGNKEEDMHSNKDERKDYLDTAYIDNSISDEGLNDNAKQEQKVKPRVPRLDRTVAVVGNSSNLDAKAAVDDIVEKTENGWICKACGKTMKMPSDIRRHAEIHIEGLSYQCPLCDKTFRQRALLKSHKVAKHRN